MEKFLTSNSTEYRLGRTIVQGVLGVIIANLPFLVSALHLSAEGKAFIVALVMAILSPIMSEIGERIKVVDDDDEDFDEDYDENQAMLEMDALAVDEEGEDE